MSKRALVPLLIAFALAVSACLPDAGPATTVPGPPTSPAAEPTTTTTEEPAPAPRDEARDWEQVDCQDPPESVAIVCEAYDLIRTRYVDAIDDASLAEAAVQGLEDTMGSPPIGTFVCAVPAQAFIDSCELASAVAADSEQGAEAMVAGMASFALDPNSAYLDPRSVALAQEERDGAIEGIGALVSPEDETLPGEDKRCGVVSTTCRILIVSTISGTPAEEAGLQRDDVIVGINSQSILGWSVDEVTATVRGPAGTDVVLTIDRQGRVFDVEITRATVVIPVIESVRVDDTGYVKLTSFNENADEQFKTAIAAHLAAGVEALVIDLRDNPGGLLDTAIEVTSIFLSEGEVVITQGPDLETPHLVTGASVVPEEMTVVFVVNRGSASASEVVSAVLQERGVVTVVGENTFGKNTVQQRFNLSNGGALRLTTARWLTPGGLDFGGVGVTPDVEMALEGIDDPERLVATVLAGM